jgi:nitrite reductase/ring-hydroxylating ferredoxin subunit
MKNLEKSLPLIAVADVSGKIIALEKDDKELCLVFHKEKWFLADNFCPHQGATMSLGYIKDDLLFCPWHKIGFALGDGHSPTYASVLRFYRVWEDAGMLWWQPE